MNQIPKSHYTIDYSIKSGQSKVEGKIARCANKGITEIGKMENSRLIVKLFVSTNLISSLSGIEKFINLKVLSISYNEIQLLSELKYLKGLSLETINMEGNPITFLPFYQHHVYVTIPTLKFFDGKNVGEKLRNKAHKTVEYDIIKLKILCRNEIRIQELENLLKFSGEKDQTWASFTQQALPPKDFESYQLNIEEQEEKFDKMREIALELKQKDTNQSTNKWSQVYDKIESVQNQAIKEMCETLKIALSQIQNTSVSQQNTASKVKKNSKIKTRIYNISSNREGNEMKIGSKLTFLNKKSTALQNKEYEKNQIQTPPTQEHVYIIEPLPEEITKSSFGSQSICKLNEVSSSNENIIEDINENSITFMPSPQNIVPQQQKAPRQIDIERFLIFSMNRRILLRAFLKWKNISFKIQMLNKLFVIYAKRNDNDVKSRFFQKLNIYYLIRTRTRRPNLQISTEVSKQIPYKPFSTPCEANIELLEKAQSLAEEISRLQADYEKAENKNTDVRKALEESVKNEEKMKKIVKKITIEKNELSNRLSKCETKYEEEVVQFMLENRFKHDQQEHHLSDIEKENTKKDREIKALKKYITETKARHLVDINELKQKLSSAVNVKSGFRYEISRLKNESTLIGKATPPKNNTRTSSNESSPDTEDTIFTHRRRRSEAEFILKDYGC